MIDHLVKLDGLPRSTSYPWTAAERSVNYDALRRMSVTIWPDGSWGGWMRAAFPEGWSGHYEDDQGCGLGDYGKYSHGYVTDDQGRRRITVLAIDGYEMFVHGRFGIQRDLSSTLWRYEVREYGEVVHTTESYADEDNALAEVEEHLGGRGFPDWRDKALYWD